MSTTCTNCGRESSNRWKCTECGFVLTRGHQYPKNVDEETIENNPSTFALHSEGPWDGDIAQ